MTTKERIFEAAVRLFAAKGFHGTSIRDIAAEVGIKESSIYNHYKGKDAILSAVLQYQMDGFNEYVASLNGLDDLLKNVDDAVDLWKAGYEAFGQSSRPLADQISRIITNEMYLNETCRRFVLESLFAARKELTRTVFLMMHKKGLIRDCDFDMAANQYVAMIHGLDMESSLRVLEGEDPNVVRREVFEHMVLFIEGLKE